MSAQSAELNLFFFTIVSWLPSPIVEYGNEPVASVLFNYLESRETQGETWSQIKRTLRFPLHVRVILRFITVLTADFRLNSPSHSSEFHWSGVGVMVGWACRMVSG
jgi:hypothetical protein